MLELTPWRVEFIRKHIHLAKMMKKQCNYTTRDDVELMQFLEEFEQVYPDKGEDI